MFHTTLFVHNYDLYCFNNVIYEENIFLHFWAQFH